MLKELSLTNFKQHALSRILFKPGLNIIRGPNGAGKTSILKGILYALFGASAAGARDHLTAWGAEGAMNVALVLDLPRANNSLIQRSFKRASIEAGEVLLASGHSPVSEFVTDHLGMNPKILKQLLYSEQGSTQALLSMGAAGLQRQLEEIAKADVVDQALALLSADCSKLRGEIAGTGEHDPACLSLLQTDLEKSRGWLKKQEAQQVSAESDLTNLQARNKQAFHAYTAELLPALSARQALHAEIQDTRQTLAQNQAELTKHTDSNQSLSNLDSAIAEQRETIVRLSGELKRALEQQMAREALQKTEQELASLLALQEGCSPLFDLLDEWQEAKGVKQRRLIDLSLAQQAKAKAFCSQCLRPFASPEDLQHAEQAIETAQAACNDANQRLTESMLQMPRAFATLQANFTLPATWRIPQDVKRFDGTIDHCRARVETLKQSLVETRAAHNRIANSFSSIEKELAKTRNSLDKLIETRAGAVLVALIRDAMQRCENKLAASEAALLLVPADLDRLIAENQALREELQETLTEAIQRCRNLAGDLSQIKSLLAGLEKAIAAEEKKAARLSALRDDLSLHTGLDKFLRSNRSKLMQEVWDSVTRYSSHLLSSTTEGLLNHLSRSETGDFAIEENGLDIPVEELSGARKSITGLCLRIALSRLFYGDSGFILLDEVTADCTEENSARIAGLLQSLKIQVILVTHREGDSVNTEHVIQL